MNCGRQAERYHLDFELLYPHHHTKMKFISRVPRPLESIDGIMRPFSPSIWGLLAFVAFTFGLMFYATHSVYSSDAMKAQQLHRCEVSKINFFLYTFSKVAEPDPVPWFTQKWSAGKLLVCLWSYFTLLAVLFYSCNLRAHLAALDHEKEIDALNDVVNNGQRAWIFKELAELGKGYLEATGQTSTDLYKVALLAEKTGGYYSLAEHGMLPAEAIKDAIENKAVFINEEVGVPRLRSSPRLKHALGGEMLYVAKESVFNYKFSMILQKYSPVRREVNRAIIIAFEFGLPQKWPSDGLSAWALLDQKYLIGNYEPKKPMHFQQLMLPAIFWSIGMILSFFVWIFMERRRYDIKLALSVKINCIKHDVQSSGYIRVVSATPNMTETSRF